MGVVGGISGEGAKMWGWLYTKLKQWGANLVFCG